METWFILLGVLLPLAPLLPVAEERLRDLDDEGREPGERHSEI